MGLDETDARADGDPMQVVAEALADEIAERRMERRELAALMGVHPSTITRLLASHRRIQIHELAPVEDALGLLRGHFLRRADLVRDVSSVRDALANDGDLTPFYRGEITDAYDRACERSETIRSTRRPSK